MDSMWGEAMRLGDMEFRREEVEEASAQLLDRNRECNRAQQTLLILTAMNCERSDIKNGDWYDC